MNPCQQRHLARVRQLVLTVRGAELQSPQHLDDLGVDAVDAELVKHFFGGLALLILLAALLFD